MSALPTGTVTFLFTDIEGSSSLWETSPRAMQAAVANHDQIMREAIAGHNGVTFKTVGDAFCAAFSTAADALETALHAQQAFQANAKEAEKKETEEGRSDVALRVRMAVHTGTADERDGDYFGPSLNRLARLLAAGHGGQTLLSQTVYDLVQDALPPETTLMPLGAKRLRDLSRPEPVYQLAHPDLRAEFPPLRTLESLPNNLPQQVTSFVGREREMTDVKRLLTTTRLLTLTGAGGAGKTRLMLQAAADVLGDYEDGVWLVELASLSDPSLVPQRVASELGVREESGRTLTQTLADWLKPKNLLLLLDNCEHLLTASAQIADSLLRAAPGLKIMTSSREGLGIAGETTYRIPSLSLPNVKETATPESLSQYEAVRLFIERAVAASPSFQVTNQNAPAVASLCVRLDGIPLAIELAAARVRALSVDQISQRLDDRFRLLTGGSRTAMKRQQALRATIDWSYDLLSEEEKTLLRRLSVFAGGWTLEAAEAVCADPV